MIKNFKYLLYLVIFNGFIWAHAGSYDDFFTAIQRDDPSSIQALLNRGFDANTRDPNGLHGLYLALREPSPKVAALLMAWPKIEIEARTEQDESPLMMAALKGNLEMARRLIAKGADVNKPGWTPLHYAATHGHLAVMQLLLDEHAYIDAESPNGTTPLMMAAQYGTLDAVKLLLEAGADPRLKNQLGLSAQQFAERVSRKDVVESIGAALRALPVRAQ